MIPSSRVQDQIGEGLLQLALAEGLQRRIQPLVDGADCRGRERVPHQFLGDLLDLPRRDPLHVHLRQCRNQRLLRALIAFEQLSREPSLAVLRHLELDLADPGDQRAWIVT